MSLDVTVIIPQCNRIDLTLRCGQSLRNVHDNPPRLLIVDDGSELDELTDQVAALSDLGDLLLLPHRGVTAAWNAGLVESRSRWLVFLNNDTVSLGAWCDRLVAPLRAGASVMTGTDWRSERQLPQALANQPGCDRFLSGWCFGIERTRLLDLGGFNESLALYFSDTDLQLRLLTDRALSQPLLAVQGLPLLHDGHTTAHQLPDVRRQWQRDRQRFHRRWRSGRPGGERHSATNSVDVVHA